MKTLKPIIAFGVTLLLVAGVFAQDAVIGFRTGDMATWCPILGPTSDPIPVGSYIGFYLVGGNGVVDPPESNGAPGGDDVGGLTNTIGNGLDHYVMGGPTGNPEPPFVPVGNLFSANGNVIIPMPGSGVEPIWNQLDVGYLRAFNGPAPDAGTHYNDLLTVGGVTQNTYTAYSPGPAVVVVCFTDAIPYGVGPCVPLEAAGPEGPVSINPGDTHTFFLPNDCTLWMTAGTGALEVTATLLDVLPSNPPFPNTVYMTRVYELDGPQPDSFFDVFFGYSQTDYDATSWVGEPETGMHMAWWDPTGGAWMKALPTTVTDTPEGGYCHVNVDHYSLWSFGWGDPGDTTQLPVELTSFEALAGDREVILNWETASEPDNAGFHIERTADGENFTRIAWVDAEGDVEIGATYTYTDVNLANGVTYTYRLVDQDINGIETISEMTASATPSFLGAGVVVTEYKLHQNYPNPFNPATNLVYDVLEQGHVTLKVYNVMGQEVASLVDDVRDNGRYAVSFDATGLSSGIYFYTVKVNNFSDTKKMLLVQ
jgi:hypothetical protein